MKEVGKSRRWSEGGTCVCDGGPWEGAFAVVAGSGRLVLGAALSDRYCRTVGRLGSWFGYTGQLCTEVMPGCLSMSVS